MVTENLEPKRVFYWFEKICSIPHGSGNTKQISDFFKSFAVQHGLEVIQDNLNNIIIKKPGSPGYEDHAPVIFQGHMDMVCEKESDCDIDFEKDGLRLAAEGDFLFARGTTLGADDGIAAAYALALLEADDIKHPPLEIIITTDEETGMGGASGIDLSVCRAKMLLNCDSEAEGHFTAGCAGGITVKCILPVNISNFCGTKYRLCVKGLRGGHSGEEINSHRSSSNVIAGELLYTLQRKYSFRLISLNGGMKDNAIPRETAAELVCNEDISAEVRRFYADKNNEIASAEPDFEITCDVLESGEFEAYDETSSQKAVFLLFNYPNGVQKMSADIEGLVETSLNMGILKSSMEDITFSFCVRSSVNSAKDILCGRLLSLTGQAGGRTEFSGEYPAWEYKRESELRNIMTEVYRTQYGCEPVTEAIHAGLECGIFAGKTDGLDAVSFGPDIFDIHTPKERLSVSSTERTWRFITGVLERL